MKINLDDLIKTKAPKLHRKLPKFVIATLKVMIKQKQINAAMSHCEGKRGVDFLKSFLDFIKVKRENYGLEKLNGNKTYIFASNHPLGMLDGLVLLEQVDKVALCKDGSKIVVNDILMVIEPLNSMFMPICKIGTQSQHSSRLINDSLLSSCQVIFFPAGFCSRRINGKITDTAWKKTFITKAIEHKRDIVPVYVDYKNSWFFYFVAQMRKKMGIKANLEMALLPSQMFGRNKKPIKIYYGDPISYEEIEQSGDIAGWTNKIRNESYNLKNKMNGTNN